MSISVLPLPSPPQQEKAREGRRPHTSYDPNNDAGNCAAAQRGATAIFILCRFGGCYGDSLATGFC